jgi:hypothetical protein
MRTICSLVPSRGASSFGLNDLITPALFAASDRNGLTMVFGFIVFRSV